MARRSGSADLPLHGGRVPPWLATRMSSLGAIITQTIVHHYGRDEFLRRLSHPFWFQSFGAVMGMDWHSSGITTSVIGALKRGLKPIRKHQRGRYPERWPQEQVRKRSVAFLVAYSVGLSFHAEARQRRQGKRICSPQGCGYRTYERKHLECRIRKKFSNISADRTARLVDRSRKIRKINA
jgi:hypothetical protein